MASELWYTSTQVELVPEPRSSSGWCDHAVMRVWGTRLAAWVCEWPSTVSHPWNGDARPRPGAVGLAACEDSDTQEHSRGPGAPDDHHHLRKTQGAAQPPHTHFFSALVRVRDRAPTQTSHPPLGKSNGHPACLPQGPGGSLGARDIMRSWESESTWSTCENPDLLASRASGS